MYICHGFCDAANVKAAKSVTVFSTLKWLMCEDVYRTIAVFHTPRVKYWVGFILLGKPTSDNHE